MAEDKKKGFPRIPLGVWFGVREKLKQKVPSEMSPSYVSSALNMTPASASANVIPALKTFGLIDDAGKPTERAYDWRDDTKYAEVCLEILDEVYPQELRDLFHASDASFDSVKSWFARTARVGDAAAGKFASTFLMLLKADLEKAKNAPVSKAKVPTAGKSVNAAKPSRSVAAKAGESVTATEPPNEEQGQHRGSGGGESPLTPKLHIDIQIHISPDSSADQIDKIFASMSKHLRDFRA